MNPLGQPQPPAAVDPWDEGWADSGDMDSSVVSRKSMAIFRKLMLCHKHRTSLRCRYHQAQPPRHPFLRRYLPRPLHNTDLQSHPTIQVLPPRDSRLDLFQPPSLIILHLAIQLPPRRHQLNSLRIHTHRLYPPQSHLRIPLHPHLSLPCNPPFDPLNLRIRVA
jgi:hypothetical protein